MTRLWLWWHRRYHRVYRLRRYSVAHDRTDPVYLCSCGAERPRLV